MTDAKLRFLGQLQNECLAVQAFITLLKEEQRFLVESDAEGIAGATGRKESALRRLTELGSARHAQWIAMDTGVTDDDFRKWIAGQSKEFADQWSALVEAAAEAKELNRINGMLINRGLAQNQNAIHVLAGAGSQQLYGRNGQSTNSVSSRSLVSG